MTIHPAFTIPFQDLITGLNEEVEKGNINTRTKGDLTQFTYSQQCTYDSNWNLFTISARGLITDREKIVAAPFPKFWNLSENKTTIPDLPFKCYQKVDGSLIIVYFYDNQWQTATKGSFNSDQAIAAKEYLHRFNTAGYRYIEYLIPEYTYLFEYIGPTNKIVISYPKEDMILLGAYNNITGIEGEHPGANGNPFLLAKSYSFTDLNSIIENTHTLSGQEEGYVIRYQDGTRVKIKGDEYCRIHRLISSITPLAIWEMLMKNDNMEFIRKELPEEFLTDFDNIVDILMGKAYTIENEIKMFNVVAKYWDDKQLGLYMKDNVVTPEIRKLIFPYRKNGGDLLSDKRPRESLFRMFRPTSNILPGYIASTVMNRIQTDE